MGRKHQLSQVKRESIVALKAAGIGQNEIARQLGIAKSSVSKILKQSRDEGTTAIRPRTGRPRKVTRRLQSLMRRSINVNPHQTANQLKASIPELREVSVTTVKRVLHDRLKLPARRALRKPLMTRSHLRKRIAFCKMTQDWTSEQWSDIMWSDESNFYLNQRVTPFVRRSRDSNPTDPRFTTNSVKHPGSIMVWACMCSKGRGGLYFLPHNARMNAKSYIDVLQNHLLPFMTIKGTETFMQDGAPCHTARVVKDWLRRNGVQTLEWPPNSPDLDPIENLWCVLKRRLAQLKVRSLRELECELQRIWTTETDENMCKNLVHSMPRRITAALKNKGFPSNY